jgi:hypothetical protein
MIVIEFYRHKTSKKASVDVLDSKEGHQRTRPDQTHDIVCHMAHDSTEMCGVFLKVVSTELSD